MHENRGDFVELKLGFFAVVSRENLEVAGSPAETMIQTKQITCTNDYIKSILLVEILSLN